MRGTRILAKGSCDSFHISDILNMLNALTLLVIICTIRELMGITRDMTNVPRWDEFLSHVVLLEELVHELKRET